MLVRVVRQGEFEVKKIAACANIVLSGSEKIQCIKDEYFPLLDEICHCCHNNPLTVVTLCSQILELDTTYRTKTSAEIFKPVFLPTNEEGRSSVTAHMTVGNTANLVSVSAKHAQQTENAIRKKKLRRCKKLSSAASPPDPLTDSRGDRGYEVTVKVLPDSSVKDLDSKKFPGENKLEKAKKIPPAPHYQSPQSTLRASWIVKHCL